MATSKADYFHKILAPIRQDPAQHTSFRTTALPITLKLGLRRFNYLRVQFLHQTLLALVKDWLEDPWEMPA
jgi:hypothetical protein